MSFFPLFGNEITIVNADSADYDGAKVSLNGHVHIENELGTMLTDHLSFFPEKKSSWGFSDLLLKDQIAISFKEGGELTCEKADFNEKSNTASFEGSQENPYVIYQDRGNESKPFFILKSPLVKMRLGVLNKINTTHLIHKIYAYKHVIVHYSDEFVAEADMGIYENLILDGSENSLCPLPLLPLKLRKQEFVMSHAPIVIQFTP